MKVIFLDIDGVLNSANNMYIRRKTGYSTSSTCIKLDEGCIDNLKLIVDMTGADIVLSSSWRIGGPSSPTIMNLTDQLNSHGMIISDYTPVLRNNNTIFRGHEIQCWLDRYKTIYGKDVERFVILDDETDMEHLMGHLIKCDMQIGLTYENALDAIHVLISPLYAVS